MIALCWLVLSWIAGWRWFGWLIGDPAPLLAGISGRPARSHIQSSPWPVLLFRLSVSLWLGLLPLTWLTYLGAAVLAPLLPISIHPLLIVNITGLPALAIWLGWPWLRRRPVVSPCWATLVRSLQQPASRLYVLSLGLWLALGFFLMCGTFYRDGTLYRAGYSVFSDFAPHTALVSSFSHGRNWPTEYPHFANDGIAYHFIFFFLCGNLNYLGLPLDWAINLPSILGLVTFCLLLGTLALCLTGRRATFLLAPLLLFCRSSFAFFTYLGDLIRQYGASVSNWPKILQAMLRQDVYIGNTIHDDWGLWGVNVYANQRHLLPGLSVVLIVLFLLLDHRPATWRRLVPAGVLCLLLPYFHGSALITLLLFMAVIGFFSCNRLAFLGLGLASVASALVQSRIFAGQATRVVQPAFLWGFIAPDVSLTGMAAYLLEMSGILLPLLLLVFWLPGRRRKILMAAFLLPLVFALTISLTPDVTVNHKYIMISFAFGNIYIADLLARIWPHPGKQLTAWARRLAAVFLAAVLMVTGLQEMIILHNISQKTVAIDAASPLVAWIIQNTRPDAVFVSAPYHYNAFYLSGRSTWLGHAYYAWSAGHDTAGRLIQEQWLLRGGDGDPASVNQMIADAGLDYLLLDDTLRNHPEFVVDENYFDSHYPVVARFSALDNLKIYDLRQAVDPLC